MYNIPSLPSTACAYCGLSYLCQNPHSDLHLLASLFYNCWNLFPEPMSRILVDVHAFQSQQQSCPSCCCQCLIAYSGKEFIQLCVCVYVIYNYIHTHTLSISLVLCGDLRTSQRGRISLTFFYWQGNWGTEWWTDILKAVQQRSDTD